jgi:hypothetical protein
VARQYEGLAKDGSTVAVTTARAETARAINRAIQHRSGSWRSGRSTRLTDGSRLWAGDRIATRRNDPTLITDRGRPVRNRQSWTVEALGPDGSLIADDADRGRVTLPTHYVRRNVELGWAVTGYGNQGATTDHGICVVEPTSTRAGVYVGMTRGRHRNIAWITDDTGLADAAQLFAGVLQRPANAITAHAARDRLNAEHGHVLLEEQRRRVARPSPARDLGL